MKAPFPINAVEKRYPNLIRQCRFVGHLTPYEASLVIWAQKNHIPGFVGGKRVKVFGGTSHLISQAFRHRNV